MTERYLMVLPDGETFDAVEGSCIVAIPDEWDIEDTIKAFDSDEWPDEARVVGAFDVRDGLILWETSAGEIEL
jgi:hypothetical protein